jgi:membrane protein required for colicin V production
LNTADIALVVMLAFGAYRGYREGFLMELFSLVGIIAGILAGFKLMGLAMIFLSDRFNVDEKVLPYLAFALVFIIVVLLITLAGRLLKASIDKSFLGRVDAVAGAVLGVLKFAFMLSVVLWITESLKLYLPERWTEDSYLLPLISGFAPAVTSWIGELVPAFKDIF